MREKNKYSMRLLVSVRERWAALDRRRFHRLAKEGSWVVIGQVVNVLGSLVLVRVLSGYLHPEQYGQLALGLTVAGLVNQVVMGGVANGISRYYSIAAENNDLLGYLHASRCLMGYATFAVAVIAMVLITGLFWLGYFQWIGLCVTTLILSVLNGLNSSLSGIQNAARQRFVVAFHGGLDAWLKILLAIGMMTWQGNSSTAVVMGYIVSSLLITGSQLFFFGRFLQHKHIAFLVSIGQDWTRKIWMFSWPFSAWGVFTWMQLASDRWSLQAFCTAEEVGQYAVVFQLGYTPLVIVTSMAISFLGPILYQRIGSATDHTRNNAVHRLAWRIATIGLLVTVLAFLTTFFLHEWLFKLLVAAPYRAASRFLPWVALAGGIFSVGQILGVKLAAEMKPAAMTTAKITTSILGVGLNILGAQQFGTAGVVAALVIFSCIYFFWMACLAHQLPDK